MAQDFSNDPNIIPPAPVETFGAPPPKKSNKVWIIIIVAVVLLCCCCVVVAGIYAWNNGDRLLQDWDIDINGISSLVGLLPL